MTDDYEKWHKREYDERVKRTSKAYRKAGKEDHRARYAKDRKKMQARSAVTRAVKSGRLVKPIRCEGCELPFPPKMLHGHHDDYDKQLDVTWFCRLCHDTWHLHNVALNGDEPMGMLDRFEKFADKTFNDAAAAYLDEFEGKCRKRQEYALQHIQPYIGDLPLIEVDDAALRTYKAERRQQAMAGTVNKEIATATAVLNKAARVWRWIPSAPKLQRVKGEHRKPYPLSWDESFRMFCQLDGNLQKICLFAINTGVRREEIFKLKWEDERDIDGVMVFILRDTKNGQDRPVICNSIARRIVEYMRQPATFVPEDKKAIPVYSRSKTHVFPRIALSKPLEWAWKEAGLPDDPLIKKGPHNFRHTFGYRLRSEGVSGEDRDALLGHHNKSLTQHYAAPDIARLAELAERVTVPRDTAVLR